MRNTDFSHDFSRPTRRAIWPVVLLGLSLLAACTPDRGVRRDEVRACIDKESPACAAARVQFQSVRYPTLSADRLVAAGSRALGDLNFEPTRDDAGNKVSGEYIASAPVHKNQLDELFRKNLKNYGTASLTAQVDILPLPGKDVGADVRLRLYTVAGEGMSPELIDSVAPYQIFFSQLGVELGAPPPPPPEDKPKDRRHPVAPSISGV
ncbi:hypothetical protein [Nevskia soli]|uniref:hypothetical protein n=1 Tax=Nevskia soli TaxID=418856 RepID=UPI0004A728E7|nr:hypothetical protein [Nevskia soli]